MYYFALTLLGAVCLFNIARILGKNSSSIASWIAPLLSAFLLIVHVIVPALKYKYGYYRWAAGYPQDVSVPQTLILCTSVALLTIALNISLERIRYSRLPSLSPSKHFNTFIFITYFSGVAFALNDLRTISQMGGLEVYLSDRIGSGAERGVERTFGFFMATGIISYVFVNCRTFTLKRAFILVTMCAFPLYYYTTLTSRNSILFILLLTTATAFLSRSIPLTLNRRFIVSLIGVAAILYLGTALVSQAAENRRLGREAPEAAWLRAADGAFGNDEALLYRAMQPDPELALGKTYLAASVAWIPRSLWPGKPTGGGPFLVNLIYPGKYVVGATGNTSYTTGLYVEAVLNFGLIGYFVMPFVWVLAVTAFARKALTARTVETQLIWIIVTLTCSTAVVYMELLGFLTRVGVMLMPLLIWITWRKIRTDSV